MSEYVFKLPDLGEGTVESEIGEWFIKVGDLVNEEDIVGTMMTDKAAVELASPVSGKVVKVDGPYYDVEEYTGNRVRLHVNNKTVMINGRKKVGDSIRAEITRGGHANSVQ